ncbi:hypothetical protein GV828_02580 [Flavobacterium sp. NST-5]|uniref:DUF4304 domain-containing protein n=1 Tax=Flavobacterium ichthyis TaxID=2698827 RepID=A0ABW9Z5G0_9FLAO|nr:hypothetical protein [Flavobacterium ichthyis]NBL64083.1 hypothetical protein [Flavobacterium ichthyis]
MGQLDTKTRKKAFDQFFKTVIIPFFAQEGFSPVSKTSKKVYKKFSDGLSVYIYFEYNTFGSGFYDVAVSYFDEEVGSETDDEYIAMPKISTPKLKCRTIEDFTNDNANHWLEYIKHQVLDFIHNNASHKSILEPNAFDIPMSREKQIRAVLLKKSQQ